MTALQLMNMHPRGATFNVLLGLQWRPTKVELFDEVIRCPIMEATGTSRALASRQGLLCSISAGANVWAALQVAQRPGMRGKHIVTILPSGAERYFDHTPLRATHATGSGLAIVAH